MAGRLLLAVFVCAVCRPTEAQSLPVTPLSTPITRSGCGTSKLCMSSEENCDPAGNSSCYFASSQFSNAVLTLEISGTTSGFVVFLLAPATRPLNQIQYVVFPCGNNNGNIFVKAVAGNSFASLTSLNQTILQYAITDIEAQGALTQNPDRVQCTVSGTLNATFFNLSSFPGDFQLLFRVFIINGTTNGTELTSAFSRFASHIAIDLANPRSNYSVNMPLLDISWQGCGSTKLCVSNDAYCNPAQSSGCYFASVRAAAQSFLVELSGTTSGYVALGLSTENSSYAFVCANGGIGFFFQAATRNGTVLTPINATVNNVQGVVAKDGTLVQCIFNVSSDANGTAYTVAIMNGTTNGTQLGAPSVLFSSVKLLDLTDPNSLNSSGGTFIASLCFNVITVLLCALTVRL